MALQWSHVLTNVERAKKTVNKTATEEASMEPRPHERGKSAKAKPGRLGCISFNGATSSRTWKALYVEELPTGHCPLQWSHVLTNVERRYSERTTFRNAGLQWSHVLTNVERWLKAGETPKRRSLQWSHVLTNVERMLAWNRHHNNNDASMEPRPHERGKSHHPTPGRVIRTLQWSHVLTNVERRPLLGQTGQRKNWLQWSHVLTNVERTLI